MLIFMPGSFNKDVMEDQIDYGGSDRIERTEYLEYSNDPRHTADKDQGN